MEPEAPANTCSACGHTAVPAPAPRSCPRVTGSATSERVVVRSRKVAPSATATRMAMERKKREEEEAAVNAELKITRPRAVPSSSTAATGNAKGPHPFPLPRTDGNARAPASAKSDENEDDEGDDYYKISEHAEPTAEQRMEAIRTAPEERFAEKYMRQRLRQGVARRPKSLLRTRNGQVAVTNSIAATAHRQSQHSTDGGGEGGNGQPLLLEGAPAHNGNAHGAEREDSAKEESEPGAAPSLDRLSEPLEDGGDGESLISDDGYFDIPYRTEEVD